MFKMVVGCSLTFFLFQILDANSKGFFSFNLIPGDNKDDYH